MVEWDMENDFQPYSYDVERSFDGVSFEKIAELAIPTTTQNNMHHFEYMDKTPKKGRNVYRVLQRVVNTDIQAYSLPSEAIVYADSELMMVYPNPVGSKLVLELFETFNKEATVDIYTVNGLKVYSRNVSADSKREEFDLQSMPAGTYYLRVQFAEIGVKLIRIVKQ